MLRSFVLAILLAASFVSLVAAPSDASGAGFSASAASLTPVYLRKSQQMTIPSPNRLSEVRVSISGDEYMLFELRGVLGAKPFKLVGGPNSELLWSPDSKAVFVTNNDGGVVGGYLLYVIADFNGRTEMRDLTPLIAKRFGHPVRCFDPEGPNVVGLKWLGSANRLLVAAEVPPHSNCDFMGTFKSFEIDPFQRRIVRSHDQLETKRLFKRALGMRLLEADDGCFRRPRTCWIPQLHSRAGER
jgi:hypothetical protein